jgi:hypothetical protein
MESLLWIRQCDSEDRVLVSTVSRVLEGKQIGRVYAGCDFRSVICELCERTSRVQTCVIVTDYKLGCNKVENSQSDLRRGRYRTHSC